MSNIPLERAHEDHARKTREEDETPVPPPAGDDDEGRIQSSETVFVSLVENASVLTSTPVEIIPGHVLRKPSSEEIEIIRNSLENFGADTHAFESNYERLPGRHRYVRTEDREQWRYWVVEVTVTDAAAPRGGIEGLEKASRLTSSELRCRLDLYPGGGAGYSGRFGESQYADMSRAPAVFDDNALNAIREVYLGIGGIAPYPTIVRAVERFSEITALRKSRQMYLLGVFAVLEGVLTHDPRGGYDSLGHQIRTKLQLLNNRLPEPLDRCAFGNISFKKLFDLLYGLRSCIAHGSDPDFEKELRALSGLAESTDFMEMVVRAVLRQALREPQLIVDLQAC